MTQPILHQEQSRGIQRRGLHLFRVSGIDIKADVSWFIIFALITFSLAVGYFPSVLPELSTTSYWVAGVVASLLFFTSILLHELAHSLVAQRRGMEVPSITLFLFGGVSELRDEPADPRAELAITIAGPLTSFALAVLFGGVWMLVRGPEPTPVSQTFLWLGAINLALGIFNLLPGLPLDGGRVLRAFLWWRHGSLERATRTASSAGKVLALSIVFLGFLMIFYGNLGGVWLILIGLFMRGAAEASYQDLILRRALASASVSQAMIPDVVTVPPDISLREFVDDHVLRHGFRGFPVENGERILGLISLDQVKGTPREELETARVRDRMVRLTPKLVTTPKAQLGEALRRMSESGVGRLLVMDDDEMVGMITKEGLMRFIEARRVLGGSSRSRDMAPSIAARDDDRPDA